MTDDLTEPVFESDLMAAGITAKNDPVFPIPEIFNQGPDSLMRENKDRNEARYQHQTAQVKRVFARVLIYRKRVRLRNPFKIYKFELITRDRFCHRSTLGQIHVECQCPRSR